MCKSCGRCVAITFIVIGVLVLISGILCLFARDIFDCTDYVEGFEDLKICLDFLDISRNLGIANTTVGGVLVAVGIVMLCCLRNSRRTHTAAAPMVTIQSGYPAAPPPPPRDPYASPYQYQNPMMYQQQHYRNPLATSKPAQLPGFTQYS